MLLGDPHFMVRSIGQEPICFDADAPPGAEILLFLDSVSGLSISGTIEHRDDLDRTVIDVLRIQTPGGVAMTASHNSLLVDGYQEKIRKLNKKSSSLTDTGENVQK